MGKKAKALKIKQYKVPKEKFLVVTNPWVVYNDFDRADFNHIGAWFDRMLRVDYPQNTRIKAIYYQRTHRNIIIELPTEVQDIEPFLGAHHYSKFFLNAEQSDTVACIYEFRYASFGDPSKQSFAVGFPLYDDIPDNLPIKDPYPLPSPAPPPPEDIRTYARPIPPEVNERIANRLRIKTPVVPGPSMDPMASQSPPSKEPTQQDDFMPYVRPSYLDSTLTTRLKQTTLTNSPDHQPKRDPYDEGDDAQVFLASIKTEESLDGHEYKPSAELLDALCSLPEDLIEPDLQVKAEETKENIKLEPTDEITLSGNPGDYQPSADLLVALATLSDDEFPLLNSTSSPPKRHIHQVVHETHLKSPSKRIKRED